LSVEGVRTSRAAFVPVVDSDMGVANTVHGKCRVLRRSYVGE
jgi:hypothetical protein